MSEQGDTQAETTAPPAEEDIISRGKGVKIETLEEGSVALKAVDDFKDLVARHKAAEALSDSLKEERNIAIYDLKATHNVSFSAIAELIGATSSLVLYLYERAQGKSAKQIREESIASAAAKAVFRETNPSTARKQTPEEKAFRKTQREDLKEFLATQKAAGVDTDDAEAQVAAEEAEDDDD